MRDKENMREPKEKTQHAIYCEAAAAWLRSDKGCVIAASEIVAGCNEKPDAIGFKGWSSVVVEVKMSRADFMRDKKKRHRKEGGRGMGDYRYYFCPTGLLKVEDMPEGWGLVYFDGKKARQISMAKRMKDTCYHSERTILVSILRRLKSGCEYIIPKIAWRNTQAGVGWQASLSKSQENERQSDLSVGDEGQAKARKLAVNKESGAAYWDYYEDGHAQCITQKDCDYINSVLHNTRQAQPVQVSEDVRLASDRTFRDLYEKLANEYCKENHALYNAIAPLLGLKPFFGTCNKEQVIWANNQREANDLPAGANIHTYIKRAIQAKGGDDA